MAYKTSVRSFMVFTPFYLMLGQQAKLPIDVVCGIPSPASDSVGQYAADLEKSLQEAYRNVRARMNAVTKRETERYDRKAHGGMFEAGDLVHVGPQPAVPRGQSRKLHCPWTCPFTVAKRLSNVAYQIQYSRPKKCRTRVVVHLDGLKLYPPSMRGVDGGVRSDCHRSSVSHSKVTNVPSPAGAHLIVDAEESDTEDRGMLLLRYNLPVLY